MAKGFSLSEVQSLTLPQVLAFLEVFNPKKQEKAPRIKSLRRKKGQRS